jgi:hypothetical protein
MGDSVVTDVDYNFSENGLVAYQVRQCTRFRLQYQHITTPLILKNDLHSLSA